MIPRTKLEELHADFGTGQLVERACLSTPDRLQEALIK